MALDAAIDCTDTNPRTVDSCSPTAGCQHLDGALCPSPSNRCPAAVCDPVTGCSEVMVADGTSCGAFSCQSASVCIAGQCVVRRPPEFSRCANASPCQGADGSCRNGVCVSSGPTDIAAAWEVRAKEQPFSKVSATPRTIGIGSSAQHRRVKLSLFDRVEARDFVRHSPARCPPSLGHSALQGPGFHS